MKGKRYRAWEGFKTLLIVLLSCSAVYLAGATLFPQGTWGLLSHLGQTAQSQPLRPSVFLNQTIRPAAFAVTWEDGRYALLSHQDDPESLDQLSAILAEALSSAGEPTPVTNQDWESALSRPGLFWEYLAPLPLDTLSRWLSGQTNTALAGLSAQRLCVADNTLYFLDDAATIYYACPLSVDLSPSLAQFDRRFSPTGARFAFEDPGYRLLRRDTLVVATTPDLPRLLAEDPLSISDPAQPSGALSQVLQRLSFHPQTNPLYAVSGGYAITDGSETLRIASNGQMTYRRSQDTDPRFPVGDSYLDATRTLAEESLGSLCGSARLYLHSVSSASGVTTVTYGYAYRGAAIRVDGSDWCAQFTIEDGAVSAFTLRPRRYTALQEDRAVLLPQEQATAGLSGLRGRTLSLLYEDDRQASPLTPFWAVRVNGR